MTKRGHDTEHPGHDKTHSVEQLAEHSHGHDHDRDHDHSHGSENSSWVKNEWFGAGLSFLLLIVGLVMDHVLSPVWFSGHLRFGWYVLAYIPVGYPVLKRGLVLAFKGEVFTEFLLMGLATIGAFYIGEYPEGVTVMLFYTVGELIQGAAVNRAKKSIKALMDVRPESATVFRGDRFIQEDPTKVKVGEHIQIKAGERVPLDGTLQQDGTFNASALTGESAPIVINKGDSVLAGMINEGGVVDVSVTKLFKDSSLSRILALVQNAQGRKAKTELFIRKFSSVYTPIVVVLAVCLTLLPWFFLAEYSFDVWLYRALIFLVISCPCALVVAIPLGYFGGIGAASRHGILFKGSSYLDRMIRVNTVVMDKTGTLTEGVFKVTRVVSAGLREEEWLHLAATLESHSTHPIAKAIVKHTGGTSDVRAVNVDEIKGHGLKGTIGGFDVLVGNMKLLDKYSVPVNNIPDTSESVVVVAVNRVFAGYITIADQIRADAKNTVAKLHSRNIRTVMLSGDRSEVVKDVASVLGITEYFGDLLPEDKVRKLEEIKTDDSVVAFVGDGINDAPVLALSDVGIAMGGLGSDAAIETADVVIQTDQPYKIITSMDIGRATNRVVWQNIAFAFAVKILVMVLGAWGVASMWEAVFADVGVALLAILNAIRIQRMKF